MEDDSDEISEEESEENEIQEERSDRTGDRAGRTLQELLGSEEPTPPLSPRSTYLARREHYWTSNRLQGYLDRLWRNRASQIPPPVQRAPAPPHNRFIGNIGMIYGVLSIELATSVFGLKELMTNPANPFPSLTFYLLYFGGLLFILGTIHVFLPRSMLFLLTLCFCALAGTAIGQILFCIYLHTVHASFVQIEVVWSGGLLIAVICAALFIYIVIKKEKLLGHLMDTD